jgi:hypothetical protein
MSWSKCAGFAASFSLPERTKSQSILRRHEAFDEVDATIEGAIHLASPFHAEARGDAGEFAGETVIAMTAVTARGFRRNLARLQQPNGNALLCQGERCRESGKAATDDRDIGPPVTGKRRVFRERRGRLAPEGIRFHAPRVPSLDQPGSRSRLFISRSIFRSLPAQELVSPHPEVLALLGEPRRTRKSAVADLRNQ